MRRPDPHKVPPSHAVETDTGAGRRPGTLALAIGAVGVVYGDIGTSPLYALDILFRRRDGATLAPEAVLGGLSLVIWALTLVIALKYAVFVLSADNDGEGGVFSLYALLDRFRMRAKTAMTWGLLLGAGMLFGDGIITPAISVLSAVEGVAVATPTLARAVVPLTVVILTALFALQRKGTGGLGRVFGPVMVAWFVVIAVLGAAALARHPEIVRAFNPAHGIAFLRQRDWRAGLLVLGAVMLVLTGGEAMYADLGHFGARPIRIGWFFLAYPCLVLNYLGQGATLLGHAGQASTGIFYGMVPAAGLIPMVVLATLATVIASQALISGVFSLVSQAVALGLFPRLFVRHTHHEQAGEVYVPVVNWALYAGCALLVVAFGSSAALGGAYGFAVSGDMLMTSIAMVLVAGHHWRWSPLRCAATFGSFAAIDAVFLVANSTKFLEGGYVPLGIGLCMFLVMVTWRWGRKVTYAAYTSTHTMTMQALIQRHRDSATFIDRNAILMVPAPARVHAASERTPTLLQLLWDRFGILPRHLIFVQVVHPKIPYVHRDRCGVSVLERNDRGSIIRVEIRFGFMEEPNVERALEELIAHQEVELPRDRHSWVVHVVSENLLPSRTMARTRRLQLAFFRILRFLSRPTYFHYGLGDEVQLAVEILPVRVH